MAALKVQKQLTVPVNYTLSAGPNKTGPARVVGGEFTVSTVCHLTGIGWNRALVGATPAGIWSGNALLGSVIVASPGTATKMLNSVTLVPGITYTLGILLAATDVYSDLHAPDANPYPITLGRSLYTNGTAFVSPTTLGHATQWFGDFMLSFDYYTYEVRDEPPEFDVVFGARQFLLTLPSGWILSDIAEYDVQYSLSSDNSSFGPWIDLGTFSTAKTTDSDQPVGSYTHAPFDTKAYYRYRYRLHTKTQQSQWSEIVYVGLPRYVADSTESVEPGAVGPGGLQSGAVTAGTIAPGAVTVTTIAANAITAGTIAAGAITAGTLAAGSVLAGNVAAGAIQAGNISTNAIQAGNIAAGAVTAGTLAAGSISTFDLFVNNVIQANALNANSVTAGKIDANAITAREISTDAIQSRHIAAGQITASELQADSVTAVAILAGSIQAGKLATDSVVAGNIKAGAINAVNMIVDGLINGVKIADNAINGVKLVNGAVTARELAADSVYAAALQVGSVKAGKIDVDAVVAGNIAAGAVQAGDISAGAINAANLIVSGTINNTHIQDGTINGVKLLDGAVTAQKILAGSITSKQVAADFLDTNLSVSAYLDASAISGGDLTLGGTRTYQTGNFAASSGDISYPWSVIGTGPATRFTPTWNNKMRIDLPAGAVIPAGEYLTFMYTKPTNRVKKMSFHIKTNLPTTPTSAMRAELVDNNGTLRPVGAVWAQTGAYETTGGTSGLETYDASVDSGGLAGGIGFSVRNNSGSSYTVPAGTWYVEVSIVTFEYEKGFGTLSIFDAQNRLRSEMTADYISMRKVVDAVTTQEVFRADSNGVWVPQDGFTVGSTKINNLQYSQRDLSGTLMINPRFENLRTTNPSKILPSDWAFLPDEARFGYTDGLLPQVQSLVSGRVLTMTLPSGWLTTSSRTVAVSHKRYIQADSTMSTAPVSMSAYFRCPPGDPDIQVKMTLYASTSAADITALTDFANDTKLGEAVMDGTAILPAAQGTIDNQVLFQKVGRSFSQAAGTAGDTMSVATQTGSYIYVTLEAYVKAGRPALTSSRIVEWDNIDLTLAERPTPSDNQAMADMTRRVTDLQTIIQYMTSGTKAVLSELGTAVQGLDMVAVN